jgi:HEAT repeat protein
LVQAVGSEYRPVRVRGLRGLIEQADESLVPTFAGILGDESDPNLRALAARGLGRTGSMLATAVLRRALHDPSEVVQEEVIQALVALDFDELAATLAANLASASDTAERVRWIRLMRYLRDERNIEILAPTLQDPDPQVRTYGAASILAILNRAERQP